MQLVLTSRFKKDYKRLKKSGQYDMQKLSDVLNLLCAGQELPTSYHDHALKGNFQDFRECHIAPDWLLIYQISNDQLILTSSRTGSHAELFGL